MTDPLAPYSSVTQGQKRGYVLTTQAAGITAALFESAPQTSTEAGGRGRIVRFPLDDGEGIVRRYHRGGALARVLGDRYFSNRMLEEFMLTARLHAAGVSVPQPLGVLWERRGPWYRGVLATRVIAGDTLHAYLARGACDADVLRHCGAAIRALHDAGVWHADLQTKNILVGDKGVWIIDLDKARVGRPPSDLARARNLLRLRRSLEKHGQSLDNLIPIGEGYGKLGLPVWLASLYRFRGMVSDALHK